VARVLAEVTAIQNLNAQLETSKPVEQKLLNNQVTLPGCNANGSLKSPASSCVSIAFPLHRKREFTASCERLENLLVNRIADHPP
jgi:hypothetical protein